MNRNFIFSLLALTLVYLFVPKISTIITIVAVTIFICQLAAIVSRLVIHSSYSSKRYVSPTNRIVLITGCDNQGGFGLATAKRLDNFGFYVLAGVLSKESEGAKHLEAIGSKRLRTIKLDVTKQEDVDEAIELIAYLTNYKPILDKLNEKQSSLGVFDKKFQNPVFGNEDGDLKLHGLVNNGGICNFNPFEFGTIEQNLMPMFEVNVVGMVRLTKGVLPFLRQSQGRIVNVGSVADRFTFGGLTGYSMTKHAVRSFTDGLRQELRKFNVKPILISPTLYRTPMSNNEQMIAQFEKTFERTDETIRKEYGDEQYRRGFIKHLKRTGVLTRNNIDEVVDSIRDAVTNSDPRKQYLCASTPQKVVFWFLSMFSLEAFDRLTTIRPSQIVVDILHAFN